MNDENMKLVADKNGLPDFEESVKHHELKMEEKRNNIKNIPCDACIWAPTVQIEASSECLHLDYQEFSTCKNCADDLIDVLRNDGYTVWCNGERCDRQDA